jgi:hypothetical protein
VSTEGFEGIYVPTHNYGKTAAFWRSLGFTATFETDHGSGQWAHPSGGPYVFIDENHQGEIVFQPILRVADSTTFAPERPVDMEREWTPQHWGVVDALLRDPDGRMVGLSAPLPPGVTAPDMDRHHDDKYGSG